MDEGTHVAIIGRDADAGALLGLAEGVGGHEGMELSSRPSPVDSIVARKDCAFPTAT